MPSFLRQQSIISNNDVSVNDDFFASDFFLSRNMPEKKVPKWSVIDGDGSEISAGFYRSSRVVSLDFLLPELPPQPSRSTSFRDRFHHARDRRENSKIANLSFSSPDSLPFRDRSENFRKQKTHPKVSSLTDAKTTRDLNLFSFPPRRENKQQKKEADL